MPNVSVANITLGHNRDRSLEGPASGPVSTTAFPKWSGALHRDWAQKGEGRVCAKKLGRDCRLVRWQHFLRGIRTLLPRRQLLQVNSYVNATAYLPDRLAWGKSDYSAAPGEFFARGGDCEDYAIAKFMSLKQLGFDPEDMRILVLRDTRRGAYHAVLIIRFQDETYVLDSLSGRLKTWAEVPDYRPLYSVNEVSFWLHS